MFVKIKKFRSITQEIVFELTKLNCFFGPNESGKTSVIKALHKFNPVTKNTKYEARIDSVKLPITNSESVNNFIQFTLSDFGGEQICIEKSVNNQFSINRKTSTEFETKQDSSEIFDRQHLEKLLDNIFNEEIMQTGAEFSPYIKAIQNELPSLLSGVTEYNWQEAVSRVVRRCEQIKFHATYDEEVTVFNKLIEQINKIDLHAKKNVKVSPTQPGSHISDEEVIKNLPKSLLLDESTIFSGLCDMLKVKEETEHEVALALIELCDIDLWQLQNQDSRYFETNMENLSRASLLITQQLREFYQSDKVQIQLQTNSNNLHVLMQSGGSSLLAPLTSKSNSVKWIFTFITMVSYYSKKYKNLHILLDAPDNFLDNELLSLINPYLQNVNRDIYLTMTTNKQTTLQLIPFENIYHLEYKSPIGTTIEATNSESYISTASQQTNQPRKNTRNIIFTEDNTTYWILLAVSIAMRSSGFSSLDERVSIVINDSATPLITAKYSDELGHISLPKFLGRTEQMGIEDFLPVDLYLKFVNQEMNEKLRFKRLTMGEISNIPTRSDFVGSIVEALRRRGIVVDKTNFRENIAKAILFDFPSYRASSIPKIMSEPFEQLFAEINEKTKNSAVH